MSRIFHFSKEMALTGMSAIFNVNTSRRSGLKSKRTAEDIKHLFESTETKYSTHLNIIQEIMAGHKNYRFCSHHRAQVLIKPAFFILKIMKKLVFMTALMINLNIFLAILFIFPFIKVR